MDFTCAVARWHGDFFLTKKQRSAFLARKTGFGIMPEFPGLQVTTRRGPQHESSHPYVNDLLLPPRPASATMQAVDHRGEVQRRSGWPGASCVRGGLLTKRPDTSLGEVHRGSCSEPIHMEEEKVEVKVHEEEVEDRERRKEDQSEGRRENKQPHMRMTHVG